MNNKIKWGVIGSGGIARKRTIPEGIIPARNAELAAVYDINAAVNKEVAQQFGVHAAESIDELLTSDVNAVYIATPANRHCEQTLACAEAKKHVLCEKPLGMTIEETHEMLSACKKAKVELGTAFMMRFQAQHQAALKMIQSGRIGEPVYARAQLSGWYPPIEGAWRQDPRQGGGGSLMDMGIHCIDLLEMFFGKVKQVSCFINNTIHHYKSEDSAVAMLYFENGAIGTVDTFFCIPSNSSKNVLELYGSKGSILARRTLGQGGQAGEMTAFLEETQADYNSQQARPQGDGIKITPEPVNMYKAEIEEFSQAILDNRRPSNGSEIGIRSQKILAACYKSAWTDNVIKSE